jgi:hypothetical protein
MKKSRLDIIVNTGLLVSFLTLFTTAIIKFPGFLRTFGISQIQLPMGEINLIHEWGGLTMGAFVFAHLIINRSFFMNIKKNLSSKRRKQ